MLLEYIGKTDGAYTIMRKGIEYRFAPAANLGGAKVLDVLDPDVIVDCLSATHLGVKIFRKHVTDALRDPNFARAIERDPVAARMILLEIEHGDRATDLNQLLWELRQQNVGMLRVMASEVLGLTTRPDYPKARLIENIMEHYQKIEKARQKRLKQKEDEASEGNSSVG
jgi:hypothetical protein